VNPFDLDGPDFLEFYCFLGVVGLGLLAWMRRHLGPGDGQRRNLSDPYTIAALRGGAGEAIRVAILALVERGLLTVGKAGVLAGAALPETVTDVLEKVIMERCRGRPTAASLVVDVRVVVAVEPRLSALRQDGLIPTPNEQMQFSLYGAIILGVLMVVAGFRFALSVTRGHFNLGFLALVAIAFSAAAMVLWIKPVYRTPRGRASLADHRVLFAPLLGKYRLSDQTGNIFLAAVYGPRTAAGPTRTTYRRLFPRTTSPMSSCGSTCSTWVSTSSCSSSSSSCSSSSSNSCSSSSGSSCSSSSCGGGSSGCGGCGSSS